MRNFPDISYNDQKKIDAQIQELYKSPHHFMRAQTNFKIRFQMEKVHKQNFKNRFLSAKKKTIKSIAKKVQTRPRMMVKNRTQNSTTILLECLYH